MAQVSSITSGEAATGWIVRVGDFPVSQSAGADAVAAATGAFVNDAPRYLQSTGSVLAREGRVIVTGYPSGAIGRLVPDDVIGLIKYMREHAAEEQAA
jgi:hypothetical protein